MTDVKFIELCKQEVANYVNQITDVTDNIEQLTTDDVFIVWQCKALQNWKALVSTTRPDGMYYELTYNGNHQELYFDAYKKFVNKKIIL